MWHFGYDSPNEYTGKGFEVAWEDGQKCLDVYIHKRPKWKD
jgi:hypothetical protein